MAAKVLMMTNFSTWIRSFGAILLTLTGASAQELSLNQVIQRALESNLGIQMSRIAPTIAEAELQAADANLDFEIFASVNLQQSEQSRTFSQTTGTASDQRRFQSGLRKQLSTGATVTAQTIYNRRDSNAGINTQNLSQSADLLLSVRQPLLRNFGNAVTLARYNRALYGTDAANAEYMMEVLFLLSDVEISYWRLATQHQNLELRKTSLELAEKLWDETRERERLGLATRVEVLQAQAAQAQRQEEIISAKAAIQDAADEVFRLMDELDEFIEDSPTTAPLPEERTDLPEFADVWQTALQRSPRLRLQDASIRQLEIDRLVANNSTRPQLDLVLSGGYLGLDDRRAREAYDSAFDRDGTDWSVGLEFSMPWGFRAERAQLLQAEKRIERAQLQDAEIRQLLLRDTRRAYRNVHSRMEAVEAARVTLELRQAAYEQELGKYENGIATFREVLEAQNELDISQIRFLEARFNRMQSEIELERVAGTLPERHGIILD
jgi:outer membrane protein TolC